MMEKNCAKKGVYEEIILSENNTRNYQSLASYFTNQNKKSTDIETYFPINRGASKPNLAIILM